MSLVHLEKSVLTFHFKEILEGGQGNHPLAWVGLGVLVLGPKLLPNLAKASQPVAKKIIKRSLSSSQNSGISLAQWIEQARQREMVTHRESATIAHLPTLGRFANTDSEPISINQGKRGVAHRKVS
jgi:hypothetical protein